MSNIDKLLGEGDVKSPFPTPVKAVRDPSGWAVVEKQDGNTIDNSADGGFDDDDAEYIAHCINQHDKLIKALHDVRRALGANPNCSREFLFDCCANANEIAHNAIYEAERLQPEDSSIPKEAHNITE